MPPCEEGSALRASSFRFPRRRRIAAGCRALRRCFSSARPPPPPPSPVPSLQRAVGVDDAELASRAQKMPRSRRTPPGGADGGAGGGRVRSLHDHASDLAEYLAKHAEVGNVIDTLNTSQRLGAPPPRVACRSASLFRPLALSRGRWPRVGTVPIGTGPTGVALLHCHPLTLLIAGAQGFPSATSTTRCTCWRAAAASPAPTPAPTAGPAGPAASPSSPPGSDNSRPSTWTPSTTSCTPWHSSTPCAPAGAPPSRPPSPF